MAPRPIIHRVAYKNALTRDTIVTGHASPVNVRTQGQSTGGDHNPLCGSPMGSTEKYGNKSGGLGVAVEAAIDLQNSGV